MEDPLAIQCNLAGNPLPHTVPRLSAIAHALTARDNGQLFLRVLTVIAWGAWATFTLAVLVEIPAAIRHQYMGFRSGVTGQLRDIAVTSLGLGVTMASQAATSAAAFWPGFGFTR